MFSIKAALEKNKKLKKINILRHYSKPEAEWNFRRKCHFFCFVLFSFFFTLAKIVIGPCDIEVDLTESFFLLSRLNAKWSRKSCLTTTSFVRVIFFSFTFYRHFAKLLVCAYFVLFFCVPPVAAEVEEPLSTPRLCIQAIGIKKNYPPSTTTTTSLLVHAENKYANLILFVEILRKIFFILSFLLLLHTCLDMT